MHRISRKLLIIGIGACLLVLVLALVVPVPFSIGPGARPDWVYNAGERIVSPALAVEKLVMLQTTSSVRALDGTTGAVRWNVKGPINPDFSVNKPYAVPMRSANDRLIVANGSAPILALSIQTGDVLWQEKLVTTNGEDVTDMQVYGNRVYVARYNSYLSAFDLSNGTLTWSSVVPARTRPQIILANDELVLVAGDALEVLDAASGTQLGEHRLDGLVEAVLGEGSTLYIALFNGAYSLESFDLESGTYRWRVLRQASENSAVSNITFITAGDETLYASGAQLAAISASDGRVLWTSKPNGPLGAAFPHGHWLYARGNRFIYAFDLNTGKETTSIPIPQPFLSLHSLFPSPELGTMGNKLMVVEGNSLLVVSMGGQ